MNGDVDTFLDTLFSGCHSVGANGVLTFSAIHPAGNLPTPSRHVPLGNRRALDRAVEQLLAANRKGWGGYVGIASRRAGLNRWSRGGRDDLLALPALFVDMDAPGSALWHLTFFDPPPSMVVHSGRGYHAYWLLDRPTNDFHTADRMLKGLAQTLGGDAVLTVANSMRLPGTVNTKPGRESTLCTILECNTGRRYALHDFFEYLPQEVPHFYRPALHRSIQNYELSGNRQALKDAVTEAVIRLLDGHPRSNGFIGARCPLPHQIDRPGMHFSYHPESGVGVCFGKHGKIPLTELCQLLGIYTARTA